MRIRRGDVFMSELIGVGSMQQGIRPVIIVSNNKANTFSSTVTVVPCTLSPSKADIPTHVNFDENSETHRAKGTALAECITTIDKILLRDKMGYLSRKEMMKINIAILIQVGINIFETIKDCTMDMFECLRRN